LTIFHGQPVGAFDRTSIDVANLRPILWEDWAHVMHLRGLRFELSR
jgi:hypothetical protein